jgi:hypothetical protein
MRDDRPRAYADHPGAGRIALRATRSPPDAAAPRDDDTLAQIPEVVTLRLQLEFQVSDPEVLRSRLTEAGLKDVRVEQTAERPTFASGQEMWAWVLYGNPIPGMVIADLGLTEEQQARLRQILHGMLRERAERDGRATLTNRVNIGIGTT